MIYRALECAVLWYGWSECTVVRRWLYSSVGWCSGGGGMDSWSADNQLTDGILNQRHTSPQYLSTIPWHTTPPHRTILGGGPSHAPPQATTATCRASPATPCSAPTSPASTTSRSLTRRSRTKPSTSAKSDPRAPTSQLGPMRSSMCSVSCRPPQERPPSLLTTCPLFPTYQTMRFSAK